MHYDRDRLSRARCRTTPGHQLAADGDGLAPAGRVDDRRGGHRHAHPAQGRRCPWAGRRLGPGEPVERHQPQASKVYDDELDTELRVAFDFDGVIADDEAESVYKKNNDLIEFQAHESKRQSIPHQPGPLADLFKKLSFMQKLEEKQLGEDPSYKKIVRIAIVTARNAPSHERVVTTLKTWGVSADESFFLGGMEKSRILTILKPHMFFDDQRSHLQSPAGDIPMVHIPFGIANNKLTSHSTASERIAEQIS